MARKWNKLEEDKYRNELFELYIIQNKTIGEIADILQIKFQTVYRRLQRLGINSCPENKKHYQNRRNDVCIPKSYSPNLAEFFGIMFGDGHLSHFQAVVTLGTKELGYAQYVKNLMEDIFQSHAKLISRSSGYRDVYIGSVELTSWLQKEGLVPNKVKKQVDVPRWIFSRREYIQRFIRGFFDTDGTVYKLRFGTQVAFTNYSLPLLNSLQLMLKKLQYKPSGVSSHKVYLTRKEDLLRFFSEIKPANNKHLERFGKFINA